MDDDFAWCCVDVLHVGHRVPNNYLSLGESQGDRLFELTGHAARSERPSAVDDVP